MCKTKMYIKSIAGAREIMQQLKYNKTKLDRYPNMRPTGRLCDDKEQNRIHLTAIKEAYHYLRDLDEELEEMLIAQRKENNEEHIYNEWCKEVGIKDWLDDLEEQGKRIMGVPIAKKAKLNKTKGNN